MIPLLLGALSVLLLSAGIFHGAAPVFRDLLVLVVPLRHYARAAVHAGTVPLWTDSLFFGAPFLANYQSAVFYPPSLILYLLPFPLGLDLFLAFHVFVGGWGAARYLSHRHQLGPVESAFGGVVFAIGGFLTSLIPLTNQLSAAAWLPWAAAAAERLALRSRATDFLWLTALFLLQALTGAPEAWLLTMALVLTLVARELLRGDARLVAVALPIAAALLAAGLAAFQLLPTAEYAAATDRSAGLSLQAVTAESLELRSLLQLLLPHTFSGAAPDFVLEGGIPLFWSVYLGIAPLALAIVALRRHAFWTVVLGFSLVLSMGESTPAFALLHGLAPRLVGLFRFPGKLFLISHLALAVLAAHGLSAATREARAGRLASGVLLALALAELCITLTAGRAPHELLGSLGFRLVAPLSAAAEGALASHLGLVALRGAALALASLGVFHQLQRGRIRVAVACWAILSLSAIDLMLVHRPVQVFVDWHALDELAAGRSRVGERIFHYRLPAGASGLEPWAGALHPGENVEQRAQLLWASLVPNAPMVYGAVAVSGSDGFLTRAQQDLFGTLAHLPRDRAVHLLAALGVDRLIGTEPLGGAVAPAEPRPNAAAPWEYMLDDRAPRIYLAENVIRAADRAAALERAAAADFRPGRDAVVVGEPSATGGRGTVRLSSFEPGHLSADLSAESAALCVVSGTWFEGWEATIDGRPTPIYPTNGLMRGVVVPAGSHLLGMRYRPRVFRVGWQISAMTAAALGIGLYLGRRRGKRP